MNEKPLITTEGTEVLDPRKALTEPTLAVDLARVELDQAIATAHRFPRSIDVVLKKIATLACYSKDAAENCVYALPRAGKAIVGPSVGFASIVAQNWGNCRVASQITYVDRREKVVIAAGRFFDLETNAETVVPVSRRIVDKQGRLYNEDMIVVTAAAAASIGARNAVLRGVPRGLWHPIWMDAFEIVRGTTETFAENKDRALKAMASFGVTPEQIYMALGLKGEIELTYEHIPTLRGMFVQLRDGSSTVEEMFDPRRMTGRGFEVVENPLGASGEASPVDGPETAQASIGVADAQDGLEAMQEAQTAPEPKNAPAASPGPAKAKLRVVKPPPQPKDGPSYVAHWTWFLANAKNEAEINQRWSAERQLRKQCAPIDEELFDAMTEARTVRVMELGK